MADPETPQEPGDDAVPTKARPYRRKSYFPEGDYAAFTVDQSKGLLIPIPECPMSHSEKDIRKWFKDNAGLLTGDKPVTCVIVKFHAKFDLEVHKRLEVILNESPKVARED